MKTVLQWGGGELGIPEGLKRGLEPREGWEHVVSWQPREECFKGLGSNVSESQEKD